LSWTDRSITAVVAHGRSIEELPLHHIREHSLRRAAEILQEFADHEISLQHLINVLDEGSCRTFALGGISSSRRTGIEFLHLLTKAANATNLCLDFGLETGEVHA
jgi:hypothetical protein